MAIVIEDTASIVDDTSSPADASVTISGSGNDRMIIAMFSAQDSNLQNYSCTFDPGGGDEQAFTEAYQNYNGTTDLGVAGWYLLDADLPSSGGTYTIRFTWTLLSDNTAMQI